MNAKYILIMLLLVVVACNSKKENSKPNIIMIMCDDLGYGDPGFNGNIIIKTPNLDKLAQKGTIYTHFYAGNSVCSPTRATFLTGRHHDRMGIYFANSGHLPAQEITIAKILKEKGYTTGHFGKWHLGTLSKTESAKGPKRKPEANFAPPWQRDYDASFVTESAITTWNPGLGKQAQDNPFYENGVKLDGNDKSLLGGAARVVVDRVIPFMDKAIKDDQPFLAVVWFHAPHEFVEAGPEYLKMYDGYGEAAHYYGCITEMDEQVGRIMKTLEDSGKDKNTLIFFCSDNGPEGEIIEKRRVGTTDGLRGRKRSLYDGGVRVPAFAVWPGHIKAKAKNDAILSTLDYFPTIAEIVGYQMPDKRPIDGENVLPILTGKGEKRSKSIPFRYNSGRSSLLRDGYKYILPEGELYNLAKDRAEENNIAAEMPKLVESMHKELEAKFESIKKSHAGEDYNDVNYTPVNHWRELQLTPAKMK